MEQIVQIVLPVFGLIALGYGAAASGLLRRETGEALSDFVFGYYLQRFANYAAYYAGLASVVTAIFFMYLVALIMIFGAEFNAALARRREP